MTNISIKIQELPNEDPTDYILSIIIGTYRAYDVHIPNRNRYPKLASPRAWHYAMTVYAMLPNWNGSGGFDYRQISATCNPNDLLNWFRYSLQIDRDLEHEITQVIGKAGWTL